MEAATCKESGSARFDLSEETLTDHDRKIAPESRRQSTAPGRQAVVPEKVQASTFVDAAAMKEKVREKLSKPKYNVFNLYHDEGCCQEIARSGVFDKATLSVIAFNALWIAIDTDMNDSPILLTADPMFVIAENFFCLYFSFEWSVRFCSFRRKCDGSKDGWFVFDSIMVFMMVMETWVFTLLILVFMPDSAGGGGNAGIMRLARLLRLSRMARMGKLLRVMPELMIMIKGMRAAMRSVFFTLVLLLIIMYVFAIAFVQLSEGTQASAVFFDGVPNAMYTLLVYGVLLDSVGVLTRALQDEKVLSMMFLGFILIAALTVMNMLVGVLCEVVSAVAATEQEEMLVNYVNAKLSEVMSILDSDGGGSISKTEFMQILDNGDAIKCLTDVGVDVFSLIDLADYIFEDDDAENHEEIELDFPKFMDVVLQLRGTNQATVKDIVDLRKFMRKAMSDSYRQTSMIIERLDAGAQLSQQLMETVEHSTSNPPSPSQVFQKVTKETTLTSAAGNYISAISSEPDDDPATADKEQQQSKLQWETLPANEVSRDFVPIEPPKTPSGHLLMMVPIVLDSAWSENLELNGQWDPVPGAGAPVIREAERPKGKPGAPAGAVPVQTMKDSANLTAPVQIMNGPANMDAPLKMSGASGVQTGTAAPAVQHQLATMSMCCLCFHQSKTVRCS